MKDRVVVPDKQNGFLNVLPELDVFVSDVRLDIYEYKENNIDCVCIRSDSLKYYKEFSEIQMFEKYLSEAKSGYVFFRDGDRFDDIEYRNTAKYKELEVPFEFIDQIRNQTINQVKIKDANYEKTEKKCIILNIDEIIHFFSVFS